MRAVQYERTGPSSVLELVEREPVDPGPGQVRVRVVLSGVNPTDWKVRATDPGKQLHRRQVPNQDGAGVVDALGDGVTGLAVGQRVWVWDAAFRNPEGTAQEYSVVGAEHVVPLPDGESYETGASLGIPALTAHEALAAHHAVPTELAPGAMTGLVVLVAGGAGAVGHAAIQLARWAGATVITTVSSEEKAALARAAGAEHVVNYRTEDAAAAVRAVSERGVDVVLEVNPLANADLDLAVAANGATIAVYAGDPDDRLPLPVRPSMARNVRWQFLMTYLWPAELKAAAVRGVSAALADGALRVGEAYGLPLLRFPLEETAAAHDAVEQGAVGKVLVEVAPAPRKEGHVTTGRPGAPVRVGRWGTTRSGAAPGPR